MQPTDGEPGRPAPRPPGAAIPADTDGHETRIFPQVTVEAAVVPAAVHAPAELEGMLLPTERVTFQSTPHPIIFVGPVVEIVVILVALTTVLGWDLHPVVRGHHVTVPLLTGYARMAVAVVAGLLLLRAAASLAARAFRYFGYRIVSTNRRIFEVTGVWGRRVAPLGNTALAGSTMSQGPLGRLLGYGTIVVPGDLGTVRDMRDPVRLYREFEAVAQGVDGDTWKPAIRQTQMP